MNGFLPDETLEAEETKMCKKMKMKRWEKKKEERGNTEKKGR